MFLFQKLFLQPCFLPFPPPSDYSENYLLPGGAVSSLSVVYWQSSTQPKSISCILSHNKMQSETLHPMSPPGELDDTYALPLILAYSFHYMKTTPSTENGST